MSMWTNSIDVLHADDTKYEPISIVHSGEVIVHQIDAPVPPIFVYRKFPISDNRHNSLFSLLSIDNWLNATKASSTIQQNNTNASVWHCKMIPFIEWK